MSEQIPAVDAAWKESGRSALDELFEAITPRDGSMGDLHAAAMLAPHAWAELRSIRSQAIAEFAEGLAGELERLMAERRERGHKSRAMGLEEAVAFCRTQAAATSIRSQAVAEYGSELQAKVERLEAALREIAEGNPDCCREADVPREDWCEKCIARTALTPGGKP